MLDEFHTRFEKYSRSIDTELIQRPGEENGRVAIVRAVVRAWDHDPGIAEPNEDYRFSGIGDASPENVGRNIVPHIIRMAECVPLGSEMLTEEGWKKHDELEVGETVFAYDIEADRLRRVPLLDVRTFDAAPLVSIKGRSINVMCTPDHKWAVTGQRLRPRLRPTNELTSADRIMVAARAEPGNLALSQRDAAILGWLATDGSMSQHHVTDAYGTWGPYSRAYIQQSKPHYVEEIRQLVRGVAVEDVAEPYQQAMPSGQISLCQRAHRFRLKSTYIKHLRRKTGLEEWRDLPRIVLRLTHTSRVAMLDAMLKGDGSRNSGGRWSFGKKRKSGVMEAFEILCTLEGIALGKLQERTLPNGETMPARSLRANRRLSAPYLRIEEEGAAKVWCPSTALGTWVMRQNNYITITGNTRAKARALRDAVNVGATALEELGDDEGEAPYPTSQREQKVRKPLRQVHPKSSVDPPHEEPANEEVEKAEVVGKSEHALVLTELQRIYYRIPDEKRPDEATVFNYAERGLKQAQERLKWMRFLAAGAGRLPEESESEDEIDAGLHDEQEEVIEELAEKLYGQESKVLSGLEWLEEEVLGHPISDLTKSGAKQLIDTMRDELGKEQVK